MKDKILLIGAILLISAAVAMTGMWRTAAKLKAEKGALEAKVMELESVLEEARSKPKRGDNWLGSELQKNRNELMRLRSEVTRLRASAKSVVKLEQANARLEAENQQLRLSAGPGAESGGSLERQMIARERWAFTGHDTPEGALISAMWAIREGQLSAYLNGLSSNGERQIAQRFPGKTQQEIAAELQKGLSGVTGVQVMERKEVSPTEVTLKVYLEGLGRLEQVQLSQAGQEWKFGGFESGTYNPMLYYMQNPELMKRYFPHFISRTTE